MKIRIKIESIVILYNIISCTMFVILIYNLPHAGVHNNINVIQSNVFTLDIQAIIHNTQRRINRNDMLEADFNRIIYLIMPIFHYEDNQNLLPRWAVKFIPEVWTEDRSNNLKRCDGLLYRFNTQIGDNFGNKDNKLVFEGKNMGAITWWRLLRDQLWDQVDSFKNQSSTGNLWVIGLIGF